MANAKVDFRGIQKSGDPAFSTGTFECFFWGNDVPEALDGRGFALLVSLPLNFTLAELRAAITTAVQAQAAAVDLTVANQDVNIQSYETHP